MISIIFHGETYTLPNEVTGKDRYKYKINEVLGKGGNGSVCECENTATDEVFALKILLNLKFPRQKRFEREIKIISGLSHEHIVTYITHGKMLVTNNKNHKNRNICVSFIIMRKADYNLRYFLEKSSSSLRFEDIDRCGEGLSFYSLSLHHCDEDCKSLQIKNKNQLFDEIW
jgi:eukaryotic-like serine/threonine-protein kinase